MEVPKAVYDARSSYKGSQKLGSLFFDWRRCGEPFIRHCECHSEAIRLHLITPALLVALLKGLAFFLFRYRGRLAAFPPFQVPAAMEAIQHGGGDSRISFHLGEG